MPFFLRAKLCIRHVSEHSHLKIMEFCLVSCSDIDRGIGRSEEKAVKYMHQSLKPSLIYLSLKKTPPLEASSKSRRETCGHSSVSPNDQVLLVFYLFHGLVLSSESLESLKRKNRHFVLTFQSNYLFSAISGEMRFILLGKIMYNEPLACLCSLLSLIPHNEC